MYIQLPQLEIRISIPDLVVDNTVIKREAYCSRMEYNIDAKNVVVFWIVQHFSTQEDGTKGIYMGDFIPDYIRPNIADNTTMCDVTTGIPIQPDSEGNYPEGVNYTGQFDFFMNMGEYTPIVVNQVIKQFGQGITDWSKR